MWPVSYSVESNDVKTVKTKKGGSIYMGSYII